MTPMGPRNGFVVRVKNPIKSQKFIHDLNKVIDVTIHPGTLGVFWDAKTDAGRWMVSFGKHPTVEGEGNGVLDIPSLDDIEFLRREEYLPKWGKPPDNLPWDRQTC